MLQLLIGDNPLHEKYPKQILGKYVVQAQTSWKLRTAGLNSETEGFIIVVMFYDHWKTAQIQCAWYATKDKKQ